MIRFGRLALVSLLLAAGARAAPDPGPFHKIAVVSLREDSEKAIDPSVKTSVLRRIEEIRAWGADCVVFDIESYGGLVTASIETGDEIFDLGRTIHTIAYVHRKAISGAAMLSLACQEIVLSEAATIGDSQVVYMGTDGTLQTAPEKMQTTVAATFRKYAEGNGYPVPIAEAMVRQEMEVIRFRRPVDPADPSGQATWAYFRSDTTDTRPTLARIEAERLTNEEVVVREGELPTFTARQAMDYGICSRIAPDLDSLLASLRAPEGQVLTYRWTWAEQVSRWLLGVKFLIFLVGAAALYLAMKTPGTGIPEVIALIAFGLFFGASAIAGFSGTLELVLFFAGILLIAVEIFVLPGFGVAGFAGLLLILGSVALAAVPQGLEGEAAAPGLFLLDMAQQFLLGAVGAFVVVFFIARYLPQVPIFRALVLAPSTPAPRATVAAGQANPLVGERGVALTALRPSGVARIGGRRLDVIAEGAYVAAETPLRVVSVRGNVIMVRAEERG